MGRVFAAVASLAAMAPSPAIAATSLTCSIDAATGPFAVEVTLDEPGATATVFLPHSGLIERRPAIFSADSVRFSTRYVEYTISRVDLTIRRRLAIGGSDSGKCVVEKVIPRKF